MSAKKKIEIEVLEFELKQLLMARRRAGEDALRALVIAEREVEIEQRIQEIKTGKAA